MVALFGVFTVLALSMVMVLCCLTAFFGFIGPQSESQLPPTLELPDSGLRSHVGTEWGAFTCS